MSFQERQWIQNYDGHNGLFYRRYVDDIFFVCFWKRTWRFVTFRLNHQPNIKFARETEKNRSLPFLDILITKHPDNIPHLFFEIVYLKFILTIVLLRSYGVIITLMISCFGKWMKDLKWYKRNVKQRQSDLHWISRKMQKTA